MPEQTHHQEKSHPNITAETRKYINDQSNLIRLQAIGATVMGLVLAGKLYSMGVDGASVAAAIKFSVLPVIFMASQAGWVWWRTKEISKAINDPNKTTNR